MINALVDYLANLFKNEHGIDLREDPHAKERLHNASEIAAIQLVDKLVTTIHLPYIWSDSSGPMHLKHNLTRAELQNLSGEMSNKYKPGTKVSHAIFGVGEVKYSEPKDENYRLDVDFENGTSKTLLSAFIEIVNDDSTEEDDDGGNEVVEAVVIAEPVVEDDSSMGKLEKLIERRNAGEVTSEEFEEAKKKILERKPQYSKETVEIAQEEVRDTIVKDSVISKSSIGGGSSKMQELEKLKEMFDSGFISKKEMEEMKKEILGK
jgi:molecular chaperone DnaK (HSP70)